MQHTPEVQFDDCDSSFTTLGGRVRCRQCNAISKRSRLRCRQPAIISKTKCRFHGGLSTGPQTDDGKKRIAKANTVHGDETRQKRREYKLTSIRLTELEAIARQLGLINCKETAGRKLK